MAFAADKTRQGAAGTGEDFTIDQSLRINDGDSPSLTRTPTSDGNRRTWTYSCWFKPSLTTSGESFLWGAYNGSGGFHDYIRYSNTSGGTMKWTIPNAANGDVEGALIANALFRDPSAWYHMVFALDTTLASATDRMRWYVNGEEITSFETDTNPAQDYQCTNINTQVVHAVGSRAYSVGTNSFDGYMAEVHFIDGLQLTPTSFGKTGTYGEWKPIKVSGLTYGTNGFYLSFAGGGIIAATGGTITTDGDYKVHSFTANGTFTPTSVPSTDNYVDYLVIAGGASGGSNHGGGGGAGGMRTGVLTVTAQAYSITVGDGGASATGTDIRGNNGANSVFSSITSTGGGGGGSYDGTQAGKAGGSGGGGGSGSGAAGSATAGQGNDGGAGSAYASPHYAGGGGGGAGAAGTAGGTSTGGAGLASSITGSSVTYAGGGGGVSDSNANAAGGSGGGGASGKPGAGVAGTANTGSGGGGSQSPNATGAGGSGIVIIRYKFQ